MRSFAVVVSIAFWLTGVSADAQRYQVNNKQFRMGIQQRVIAELRTSETTFTLMDTVSQDTLLQVKNYRHSAPRPQYYWAFNGNYLIVENAYGSDVPRALLENERWFSKSAVIIYDLTKKEILTKFNGFFMTRNDHYNERNETLVYYSVASRKDNTKVMAYDLKTNEIRVIKELECFIPYHFPRIKVNDDRTIRLNYHCLQEEPSEYDITIGY